MIIRLRSQDLLILNYIFFPQQESSQMKALHDIMMLIMEMVMTMMGHRISGRKQTVSLVGEGC